jgi:hypothetical protein
MVLIFSAEIMAAASTQVYRVQNKFGMSVSVATEDGRYSVLYDGEDWLGSGLVSALVNGQWYRNVGLRPQDDKLLLDGVKTGSDQDVLGGYDYVDLSWKLPTSGIELKTGFRLYRDKPHLVFVQRFPRGFQHYASGDWTVPSVVFPQFISDSQGGRNDLHSWVSEGMGSHKFGYGKSSSIQGTVDLLLLSDDSHKALILSPFSHYLVATQQSTLLTRKDQISRGIINCGVEGLVDELPSGFEQKHILVAGRGINETFGTWGKALLDQAGKKTPSKYQDDTLKYLVYMDDAGAYYYDHDFKESGYKTYADIILGIEKEAKEHDLRIGAYHILDDPQQRDRSEGLFEPRTDLFPEGLARFHERLGKPLELYMMWIRSNSPYRKGYAFFDTGPGEIPDAMGNVFYTPEYWRFTADKLVSWGTILLQHDYLSDYEGNQVMMSGLNKMDIYFKNMAKALQEKSIDIQYCMQLPRNVMESAENPVMVSLQGSWDHHVGMAEPNKPTPQGPSKEYKDEDPFVWKHLIFTSAFYGAVGIWPSRDNIQTIADPNAFEDTLLANLLGGSIQLGHRIGECNFDLLRHTYREGDGLVLKPDRPIVPLDRCYSEGCAVGYTVSKRGGREWFYVLSLPTAGYLRAFNVSDLGVGGKWVVYNFDSRWVSIEDAQAPINFQPMSKHEYLVVAPLLENGMAVIGDTDKFVTMADMRVSSVEAMRGGLRVGVISNQSWNPVIVGYAPERPGGVEVGDTRVEEVSSLHRLKNTRTGWFWDHQTKLWHVKVDFAGAPNMEAKSFWIH